MKTLLVDENDFKTQREKLQYSLENKYLKSNVQQRIQNSILMNENIKLKIKEGVSLIESWIEQPHDPSRQELVDSLRGRDFEKLVLAVFVTTLTMNDRMPTLVQVSAELCHMLNIEGKPNSVGLMASIIAVLSHTGIFILRRPSNFQSIEIQNLIGIHDSLKNEAALCMFPLPMLAPPKKLKKNFSSPYTSASESVMLGHIRNHHDGEMCLDVINIQNSSRLSLDLDFMASVSMPSKLGPKMYAQFTDQLNTVAGHIDDANNLFWLAHRIDKRGRLYTKGHHVNYQGTPWQKACVVLHDEEPLTSETSSAMEDKGFTPMENMMIDMAGLHPDSKGMAFDERLQWTKNHLKSRHAIPNFKKRPLYLASMSRLLEAQEGIETRHLVRMDASCSGLQIMSAIMGCENGCTATGLISDQPADAYMLCARIMSHRLGEEIEVERDKVKMAVMTAFYGSVAQPESLFKNKHHLETFYAAVQTMAPGAYRLLHMLISTWNPRSIEHSWQMPDGMDIIIKSIDKFTCQVYVPEIDSRFNYIYEEVAPHHRSVSNAANVIHSLDAYVVRSMIRRCTHKGKNWIKGRLDVLNTEKARRNKTNDLPIKLETNHGDFIRYKEIWNRSLVVDGLILDYVTKENVACLHTDHLDGLIRLCNDMSYHEPFTVLTVHDDFSCHPNNMNHLRHHYRSIMSELCRSRVIEDVLYQLTGLTHGTDKDNTALANSISQSTHAIC